MRKHRHEFKKLPDSRLPSPFHDTLTESKSKTHARIRESAHIHNFPGSWCPAQCAQHSVPSTVAAHTSAKVRQHVEELGVLQQIGAHVGCCQQVERQRQHVVQILKQRSAWCGPVLSSRIGGRHVM
jgi:hypothetical protein